MRLFKKIQKTHVTQNEQKHTTRLGWLMVGAVNVKLYPKNPNPLKQIGFGSAQTPAFRWRRSDPCFGSEPELGFLGSHWSCPSPLPETSEASGVGRRVPAIGAASHGKVCSKWKD